MDSKFILADRHGLLCRISHANHVNNSVKSQSQVKNNETISIRTNSETDLATVKSSESSYATDSNALSSSIEYLNLCVNKDAKKTDSFFHLFSNENSTCVHQRKTVTIMEPGGHKFHPVKSIKKDKTNDGSKKIIECNLTMKHFLDVSSSNLTALSRNIHKLSHITHLYIYSNKIPKIPKEIGNLTNLKELWMQENNIDYLPSELKHCKLLRHLDLRHNHLGDECLVVLKYLNQLEILLLTHNKLTRLDGIGRLKKLENLSVKSNKLEGCVTKAIGKLQNLISLDLSKNRIIKIPEEIGDCVNMKRINLDYNSLTSIPESIGNLVKLDTIALKYNSIESLPYSLSNCNQLKELNVENNSLEELPMDLYLNLNRATRLTIAHNNFTCLPKGQTAQYKKTEKINAEYNHIKRLSGALVEAKELKVLNLSCNNLLEILPGDLCNLKNLVDLNLSFNHLVELPKDIGQMDHLESLDLTNNNLITLPAGIGELLRLKVLILESNNISDLPFEFNNLDKLRNLNISSNHLKILPDCIACLKNLEMLNLSENFLDELPDNISNLTKLTHLFLKDNKLINNLPISLVSMKKLSFLSLNGCPLKEIPSEYNKSPITVMAYLRAVQIGQRLKEYIQSAEENSRNRELFASDSALNKAMNMPIPSNKSTTNVQSSGQYTINSRNKPPKATNSTEYVIRPRCNSASASSKMAQKSLGSDSPTITVPTDLIKKMKTTEAGFLACSYGENSSRN